MPSVRLLNREDRDRVRRFISLHEARLAREEEALALLSARLERSYLIEAFEFPPDVVTLDSQVRMRDEDSGRLYVTTIALSRDAKRCSGASLLRGYPRLALLGARVGDDIVWRSAGRLRRARIEQILFQPESSARRASSRLPRTSAATAPLGQWGGDGAQIDYSSEAAEVTGAAPGAQLRAV
jgi:regulator of nucleoside diphosphate kinase